MDIDQIKQMAIDINNTAQASFEQGQAFERKKPRDIDNIIDDFIDVLDFDAIIRWAYFLDVEVNYPGCGDLWPDWQNELAVEVGDAIRKVGEK